MIDVVGGVNINHHIRALAAPVDLLVATPGRAEDLINQGKLDLGRAEITALDEADQMADMGFLPQVRKLLDRTPNDAQRMLFSATLDGDVEKLVQAYMHDPVTHSTAPAEAAVDTMAHYVLEVGDREQRNDVVLRIGAREGRTIMFMRTKHGVDRQVKKLRRAGIHAQGLHGDKGQGARTRAIEGFSDGSTPVLVATDIAAAVSTSGVSLSSSTSTLRPSTRRTCIEPGAPRARARRGRSSPSPWMNSATRSPSCSARPGWRPRALLLRRGRRPWLESQERANLRARRFRRPGTPALLAPAPALERVGNVAPLGRADNEGAAGANTPPVKDFTHTWT